MGNVEFDLLVICWGFLHLNQATICLFIRHIHLCVWGGCTCAQLLQLCPTFCDPWTIAPLSKVFSRQEYWNGLPSPPPGNLPNPRIKPWSTALKADSLPSEPPGQVMWLWIIVLPIACVCACSVVSDSLRPHVLEPTRLCLCPWNFPGKNTGIGCYFPLQGIFLTQGPDPRLLGLLHWQASSFPLCHLRSPNKDASDKLAESSPW